MAWNPMLEILWPHSFSSGAKAFIERSGVFAAFLQFFRTFSFIFHAVNYTTYEHEHYILRSITAGGENLRGDFSLLISIGRELYICESPCDQHDYIEFFLLNISALFRQLLFLL